MPTDLPRRSSIRPKANHRLTLAATLTVASLVVAACSSSSKHASTASSAASTPMAAALSSAAPVAASATTSAAAASSATAPAAASSASTPAVSSSPAAASSSGVAQAASSLAPFQGLVSYTPSGSALSGVGARLKGKTVYYVPITQQVPIFPIVESGLSSALSTVGATLHVCDGGATPSTTTACLNQAIAANAAAVVTDSIPFGFAQQGFLALEQHHIPILLGDEPSVGPNGPVTGNDTLAFLETNQTQAMALSADWIIANSGGKADTLVIEITDSPLTVQAITDGALKQFSDLCPSCTVHTVQESTANLATLPSLVSSALLKDPNIGYVFSEFDTDVPPTVGGVVQAGRSGKVIGVSSMGILGSLQMLASKNYLYEDSGTDGVVLGWSYADQVFRMLLGQPVLQTAAIPQRIFTRDNVGSLSLTAAEQNTGAWYGDPGFTASFKKLWGLG